MGLYPPGTVAAGGSILSPLADEPNTGRTHPQLGHLTSGPVVLSPARDCSELEAITPLLWWLCAHSLAGRIRRPGAVRFVFVQVSRERAQINLQSNPQLFAIQAPGSMSDRANPAARIVYSLPRIRATLITVTPTLASVSQQPCVACHCQY